MEWLEDKEEEVNIYWMTLNDKQGHWKLNEHVLDRAVLRTRFGRDYVPVIRQTKE
jgi:hypothetical protein